MTGYEILLLVPAGFVAGISNGIAGGGSLLAFPTMLAVGYPALTANVTCTVGLWPSPLGGAAGYRRELERQGRRLRLLLPSAFGGGLVGCILLLTTPASAFSTIVPYLILAACLIFASQPLVARALRRRRGDCEVSSRIPWTAHGGIFLASIYGGYFGAGLGVILLAILGIALDDTLHRINGLRTLLGAAVNLIALLVFVFAAHIAWGAAGILAITSLIGGYLGARLARRLPTWILRTVVVAFGLAAAIRLLVG